MSDRSAIEWTDASWNPLVAYGERLTADATGYAQHRGWHCEHVSEGCRFCYAEAINRRLGTGRDYKPGHRANLSFRLDEKTLLQPLRWRKPRKIFPMSMSDIFGDWVTDEQLDKIFAVMALCPQHTFQVLTKRAERMRTYWLGEHRYRDVHPIEDRVNAIADAAGRMMEDGDNVHDSVLNLDWPLSNVWKGISCEDQATADERIPLLLQTPAAVRFISAEPLLGAIDLTRIDDGAAHREVPRREWGCVDNDDSPPALWWNALTGERTIMHGGANGDWSRSDASLEWVIVGGESGSNARPMHPDWARKIIADCAAAGVAKFFKQWGEHIDADQYLTSIRARGVDIGRETALDCLAWFSEPLSFEAAARFATRASVQKLEHQSDGRTVFRVGKKRAGRKLDGVEHNEFPQVRA